MTYQEWFSIGLLFLFVTVILARLDDATVEKHTYKYSILYPLVGICSILFALISLCIAIFKFLIE